MKLFFSKALVVSLLSIFILLPSSFALDLVKKDPEVAQSAEYGLIVKQLYKAASEYKKELTYPLIACANCATELDFFGYMTSLLAHCFNSSQNADSLDSSKAVIEELTKTFLQKSPEALAIFMLKSIAGDKKVMDFSCGSCLRNGIAATSWQYLGV